MNDGNNLYYQKKIKYEIKILRIPYINEVVSILNNNYDKKRHINARRVYKEILNDDIIGKVWEMFILLI